MSLFGKILEKLGFKGAAAAPTPVLRNYLITPTQAPADIRDASHPAQI
jgi:hypothetical protein